HKCEVTRIFQCVRFAPRSGAGSSTLVLRKSANCGNQAAHGDPAVTQLIDELRQNAGRVPDEQMSDPRSTRASPSTKDQSDGYRARTEDNARLLAEAVRVAIAKIYVGHAPEVRMRPDGFGRHTVA